jgi:hypothetical protein
MPELVYPLLLICLFLVAALTLRVLGRRGQGH